MLHKKLSQCPEFLAGDHTLLREVLHPKNDQVDLPYSLAFARLTSNQKSLPHKLTKSEEVYYFLAGEGRISIDGITQNVQQSDIVVVPANALQFVENLGAVDLEFLCIVSPPWNEKEEAV